MEPKLLSIEIAVPLMGITRDQFKEMCDSCNCTLALPDNSDQPCTDTSAEVEKERYMRAPTGSVVVVSSDDAFNFYLLGAQMGVLLRDWADRTQRHATLQMILGNSPYTKLLCEKDRSTDISDSWSFENFLLRVKQGDGPALAGRRLTLEQVIEIEKNINPYSLRHLKWFSEVVLLKLSTGDLIKYHDHVQTLKKEDGDL